MIPSVVKIGCRHRRKNGTVLRWKESSDRLKKSSQEIFTILIFTINLHKKIFTRNLHKKVKIVRCPSPRE